MGLRIRLLGTPEITRDGSPVRLAGRKPWALLAMLVLDPGTASRNELMTRLTPEADDPQAALRWLLHQVRRALEPEARITEHGSRLRLELGSDTSVDVTRILALDPDPAEIAVMAGGTFLAGMDFPDAPALDLWLSLERSRIGGAVSEALWWAATRIADADPALAMQLVRRGLDIDPYCETKHELIVDLHLRQGDLIGAQRHAEAVERLYRRDLGIDAPDWIRRPLGRHRPSPANVGQPPASRATIRALLLSAESRLMAGDGARALETARRALDAVAGSDDPSSEIAALLVLGRAITQTGRAPVAEAKGLLSRAATLAVATHDLLAVADAQREIGVALLIEGNYGAAEAVLNRSAAAATGIADDRRIAKAATFSGVTASHQCEHATAAELLRGAVSVFARLRDEPWLGYAQAMLARSAGRSGDHATAIREARASRARLEAAGWVGALPWPLLAEADGLLATGEPVAAEDLYRATLALAEEIGDPTTEGLALRGLGQLALVRGDRREAIELLTRALDAVCRFGDGHAWATASILTDLVDLEEGRDADHVLRAVRIAEEGPIPDLMERLSRFRTVPPAQTLLQTVSS